MKDSIGFLAVEENLNDRDFVNYIKELYVRFPTVTFKAFYFSDRQKKIAESIFSVEIDRFEMILPKDIYQISNEIEIYIHTSMLEKSYNLLTIFRDYAKDIYISFYVKDILNKSLYELDNNFIYNNNQYYGYTEEELLLSNKSTQAIVYNTIISKITKTTYALDLSISYYDFVLFESLNYVLLYKEYKEYIYKNEQKTRIALLGN